MLETLVTLLVFVMGLLLIHRHMSDRNDSSGARQRKLITAIARLNQLIIFVPIIYIFVFDWSLVKTLTSILYIIIGFNAFSYSYFHLFNMSETGRRIRMLREIRDGNIKCEQDIGLIYSTSSMILERLSRLQELNQITKDINGRYVLTGRLLVFVAVVFRKTRRIVLGQLFD